MEQNPPPPAGFASPPQRQRHNGPITIKLRTLHQNTHKMLRYEYHELRSSGCRMLTIEGNSPPPRALPPSASQPTQQPQQPPTASKHSKKLITSSGVPRRLDTKTIRSLLPRCRRASDRRPPRASGHVKQATDTPPPRLLRLAAYHQDNNKSLERQQSLSGISRIPTTPS